MGNTHCSLGILQSTRAVFHPHDVPDLAPCILFPEGVAGTEASEVTGLLARQQHGGRCWVQLASAESRPSCTAQHLAGSRVQTGQKGNKS